MRSPKSKKLQRYNNFSYFVLIGPVILLIPFLFSKSTIDPVLLPRFLAWSVFLSILITTITLESRWNLSHYNLGVFRRPIFLVFICYLIITALSLFNTINFSEWIFEWLKLFMSLTFLSVSCIIIGDDKNRILIIVKIFVVLGTLLSTMGIFQYFGLAFTSIPGNYLIYATMAHKNLFASALFLILPFVLFGSHTFPGFWRIASTVATTAIGFSILLTKSRTVWVAVICATIFLAIVWAARLRKTGIKSLHQRFDLKKCIVPLAAGLVLISLSVWHYGHDYQRLSSAAAEKKVSAFQVYPLTESIFNLNTLHQRVWLWQKSWEMIKENPLLGVGLGQWRIHFPFHGKIQEFRASDDGIKEIIYQRPHNDYIWVLAESGILGLLFFLAIFSIPVFYCLKMLSKAEDKNTKYFAGFMLFGLIGYMIISLFSFPRERVVHNIFLILIIACIVSIYHSEFPPKSRPDSPKIGVLSMMALFFLAIGACIGFERLQSEIHTRKALSAYEQENWQTVISEIDASNTSFYQLDPTSTPLYWYRGMANYSMGRFELALGDFSKAYQAHPFHLHVLNNLGTNYAKLGNYRQAIDYYQKALDASPGFKDARINLGVVYYQIGDLPNAYRSLEQCQMVKDDARVFIYLDLIEDRLSKIVSGN